MLQTALKPGFWTFQRRRQAADALMRADRCGLAVCDHIFPLKFTPSMLCKLFEFTCTAKLFFHRDKLNFVSEAFVICQCHHWLGLLFYRTL